MWRSRKRAKRPKANFKRPDTEQWLAKNPGALIDCPSQPGKLKISPASCAKRHRYANDPRWANIGAEPFHIFVFKMNLVPCKECKIGAQQCALQEKAA